MSHSAKKPSVAAVQEYEQLKATVKRFEEKGLFDTAHHEMLRRLLKSYPQLESSPVDEVSDWVKEDSRGK